MFGYVGNGDFRTLTIVPKHLHKFINLFSLPYQKAKSFVIHDVLPI